MKGADLLRLVLGWAILAGWVASIILAAVDRTYNPPYTIHLLMMVVVGALFGPTIAGRRRNGS